MLREVADRLDDQRIRMTDAQLEIMLRMVAPMLELFLRDMLLIVATAAASDPLKPGEPLPS